MSRPPEFDKGQLAREISERVKHMKPEHKKAFAKGRLDPTLCRKITFAIGQPEIQLFHVLDSGMDNVLAYRLGQITAKVGTQTKGVGDEIDRGLILLEELRKKGFQVIYSGKKPL